MKSAAEHKSHQHAENKTQKGKGLTDEPLPALDARIRKAVEADIQQYLTDGLTPDRGYGTPIDNVRALILKLLFVATKEAEGVVERTKDNP